MALTKATVIHRSRGVVRLGATLVTDAAGVIAATSIGAAYGRIVALEYAPGTIATGATVTVTDQGGATVLVLAAAGTVARHIRPTGQITTNAGVAIAGAATATMTDRDIYVAGDLRVAVSAGGNVLTGSIAVIVDETPSAN